MDDHVQRASSILKAMVGEWAGETRTWFKPGDEPDVSPARGSISAVPGSQFVVHEYEGSVAGKGFTGMALLGYNQFSGLFESAWVDSYHMPTNIMFATGEERAAGFTVRGSYQYDASQEAWGWRTQYTLEGSDLTITSYNIPPGGVEYPAIETVYQRVLG